MRTIDETFDVTHKVSILPKINRLVSCRSSKLIILVVEYSAHSRPGFYVTIDNHTFDVVIVNSVEWNKARST